jgi:hypothetical protein
MKKLILEILNSQYGEWVRFAIPIVSKTSISIYKIAKKKSDEKEDEQKLPWVGLISGIDKEI